MFCVLCADLQGNVSVATRAPNLGIVVYLLRQYTNEFLATYDQHKRHVRKLSSLAELSNEELKEVSYFQNLCIVRPLFTPI